MSQLFAASSLALRKARSLVANTEISPHGHGPAEDDDPTGEEEDTAIHEQDNQDRIEETSPLAATSEQDHKGEVGGDSSENDSRMNEQDDSDEVEEIGSTGNMATSQRGLRAAEAVFESLNQQDPTKVYELGGNRCLIYQKVRYDLANEHIDNIKNLLLYVRQQGQALADFRAEYTAQRERDLKMTADYMAEHTATANENRQEDEGSFNREIDRIYQRLMTVEVQNLAHDQQMKDVGRRLCPQACRNDTQQPQGMPRLDALSLDDESSTRDMDPTAPVELPDTSDGMSCNPFLLHVRTRPNLVAEAHRSSAIQARLEARLAQVENSVKEHRCKPLSYDLNERRLGTLERQQRTLLKKCKVNERVGRQYGRNLASLNQGHAALLAEQQRQSHRQSQNDRSTRDDLGQLGQRQSSSDRRADRLESRLQDIETKGEEFQQAQLSLGRYSWEHHNQLQSLTQSLEATAERVGLQSEEIRTVAALTGEDNNRMQIDGRTLDDHATEIQALRRDVQAISTDLPPYVDQKIADLRRESQDALRGLYPHLRSEIDERVQATLSWEDLHDLIRRLVLREWQGLLEATSKTSVKASGNAPTTFAPMPPKSPLSPPTTPPSRKLDKAAVPPSGANFHISVKDSYNQGNHCTSERCRPRQRSTPSREASDSKRKPTGDRAAASQQVPKRQRMANKYMRMCAISFDDPGTFCNRVSQLTPADKEDPGNWYCQDHEPR
ncbi:MAG: hypothetical protein Q9219_005082 [cf. Caloplaca sp. 3 TL-2023]